MRPLLLAAITAYQRYVSPYKGFRCAYRAHTGRRSCSALGYRAVRRFGALRGLAILRRRTYLCGVAHRRYGATGDCPSAFQTQRGFCDAGCDFPCELPSLDGCLSGLDAASWCDCGSCDWPSRRRHDEREQYVHIPPRSGI